jgi:hypothetical protein
MSFLALLALVLGQAQCPASSKTCPHAQAQAAVCWIESKGCLVKAGADDEIDMTEAEILADPMDDQAINPAAEKPKRSITLGFGIGKDTPAKLTIVYKEKDEAKGMEEQVHANFYTFGPIINRVQVADKKEVAGCQKCPENSTNVLIQVQSKAHAKAAVDKSAAECPACEKCPAAKANAASACEKCPAAKVNAASACEKCPAVKANAASACEECPAVKANAASACEKCPAVKANAASACEKCPAAKANAASACEKCPAVKANAASACEKCPAANVAVDGCPACEQCPNGVCPSGKTCEHCPGCPANKSVVTNPTGSEITQAQATLVNTTISEQSKPSRRRFGRRR